MILLLLTVLSLAMAVEWRDCVPKDMVGGGRRGIVYNGLSPSFDVQLFDIELSNEDGIFARGEEFMARIRGKVVTGQLSSPMLHVSIMDGPIVIDSHPFNLCIQDGVMGCPITANTTFVHEIKREVPINIPTPYLNRPLIAHAEVTDMLSPVLCVVFPITFKKEDV